MVFIKKKNIIVTLFSSAVIAVVLVSTLVGYSLYIQWGKDNFALKYRNSIYKLTAELFSKDIAIYNVNIKMPSEYHAGEIPVFEGSIKNNTGKTIVSLSIDFSFVDSDGAILYRDRFYPLGDLHSWDTMALPGSGSGEKVLLPGEVVSFRHSLRNCPEEVVDGIAKKESFAKTGKKDVAEMRYSLYGLKVL